MNHSPSFVADALARIETGLVGLIGSANLQVRTGALPRSLAARVRGALRELERLLRRVILLMALAVLPGLAPRAPKRTKTAKPQRSTRTLQRLFRLLPAPLVVASAQGFPDIPRATGPVPLHQIFSKFAALQTVLAAPEAHAKRLAHHLRARIVAGEARPVVLARPRPRRITRDLAMIAEVLPLHLKAALKLWPDTS